MNKCLAMLLLMSFGCADHSMSPAQTNAPSATRDPESKSKDIETIKLSPLALWIIVSLVGINVWQLQQIYKLNRETGTTNAKLGRITSDTESEKKTRARVNALILRKLGFAEKEIRSAVAEDDSES